MSAVSSVAGSTTDLFQILQAQSQQTGSTSAGAADSADPTAATDSQTAATSGHHHHHHGGGGGGGLSKIESAVTSALQSSDGTEDPNQIIKDAITKALESPVTGNANSTTPGSATDPSTATSDPTASNSAFNQLLQSYGVDPQQFGQDLQSALSSSQSGNGASGTTVDFATLFQSFPPGSAIETTG